MFDINMLQSKVATLLPEPASQQVQKAHANLSIQVHSKELLCTLSTNTAESTLIPCLEGHRNCLSGCPAYPLMFKDEHPCPFCSFQEMMSVWQFANVPCRLTCLNTWSTAAGAVWGVVCPC